MSTLYRQPTNAPTRKVRFGALLGAPAGAVLVGMVARWLDLDVTPEEAATLGALLGGLVSQAVSYFTREST